MTDAELLHLALAHADRLLRFALQLSGDRDQADDLVQETFIRALKRRDQLAEVARVLPWLMQILRMRFLEERRTAARRLRLVTDEALQAPPVGNLEDELLRGSLSDDVARALDELPEEWRTALLLSDVEGFAYDEVASIMESPIGTVRSRIARARAKLIDKLSALAAERGIGRGGKL